jgi:hypothetical protein
MVELNQEFAVTKLLAGGLARQIPISVFLNQG